MMAEINSPRKTRSRKLLGGAATNGGEGEDPGNAGVEVSEVEEIVREETIADIIDLTEDYIDVDDDDTFGDLLGDVTGATNNEDNAENRNITIVDDDTQTGTQGNEDIAEEVNNPNDSVDMFDDFFDVPDESIDDMMATLGDGTGATINEDNAGDGTITIVDDDTPTDETTDDAVGEDRIQGNVLDVTVDLTDSPLPASTPAATSEASSTVASTLIAGVTCRICLESQSDLEKEGLNLLSTVCGHIFCSKCLPSYIKNKGLCPICRKVLRPKDFHQIFL